MSDDREQARREVQLRRFIAEECALDWRGANLLQGSSIEELTASAQALRRFLDERRGPEQPPDLITAARIATAERKRELQDIITGRAQQRDRYGRFLASGSEGGGFDGGVRQTAPFRQSPEVEHNETLLWAMRSGESNVGGNF